VLPNQRGHYGSRLFSRGQRWKERGLLLGVMTPADELLEEPQDTAPLCIYGSITPLSQPVERGLKDPKHRGNRAMISAQRVQTAYTSPPLLQVGRNDH